MNSPRRLLALAAASLAVACSEPRMSSNVDEASSSDALEVQNGVANNGISNNGLASNGISNNGISNNGVANNGVANNGLSTWGLYWGPDQQAFADWYHANPAYADMVMTYAVRCALYDGDWAYFWDPWTGVEHWYWGKLGLAPDWGYGPPSEFDEQMVTACMGALSNKFGQHVSVSLQGRNEYNEWIPLALNELTSYSFREGCFFGNFFRNQGVYAGLDHANIGAATSSVRACALDQSANGTSSVCPPIVQVGSCGTYCTTAGTSAYAWCTYGGRTYPAVTTRLRPATLSTCGDGVCSVSEKCGSSNSAKACADCGACK